MKQTFKPGDRVVVKDPTGHFDADYQIVRYFKNGVLQTAMCEEDMLQSFRQQKTAQNQFRFIPNYPTEPSGVIVTIEKVAAK